LIQIVCKLNDTLFSPEFVGQHRKNKTDFTRKRSLTFPHLIGFMLNMVNGSIQSELSRFFHVIQNKSNCPDTVTSAAFCKARKKISYTAFKSLNNKLVETFYESSLVKRWNGLRLLAVDGSVTKLPNTQELLDHFGKARLHSNRPAARLSQLYDVSNKITVDLEVGLHSTGERDLAVKHLSYAGTGDLVLYDRGYPATWLFILHKQKGIQFCARATLDSSNIIKEFVNSGKNDALVTFPCVEKSLRKCRKLGLPTTPITLRLIRIELSKNSIEVLITSLLDQDQFPYKEFKILYHQRWFIEEDYKIMKSRLEIENFSGFSVEAIQQDIHAKVLTKNLAALSIIEAESITKEKYKHRKFRYKINFTYALSQLKDNIIRFILRISESNLSGVFINQIACAVNAVRPGRKFDRGERNIRRNKYPTAYKRVR